ncbi:MAG: hypothetical protein ABI607_14195 [Betaproteobacteria bacterium]
MRKAIKCASLKTMGSNGHRFEVWKFPSVSHERKSSNYFVDMLFRGNQPLSAGAGPDIDRSNAEASAIISTGLAQGSWLDGDKDYLAQMVSRRTGLTPAEAQDRVAKVSVAAKAAEDAAIAKAKQVADAARKAAAYLALWVFASLLFGAFCAALAATIGGRQRDFDRPSQTVPAY